MAEPAPTGLPWRGPGDDRPGLPVPPGKLPLRRNGSLRKQWRYVAAFADEFHICAARVQVGPIGQTFWAIVDRERGQILENTKMRLPGARGEVFRERQGGGPAPNLGRANDAGLVDHISAGDVRVRLRVGEGEWAESICPAEPDNYVWTRKRCGIPVHCHIRFGDREWKVEARGVEDESAGYHPRHTVWSWSAGVGTAADGRPVGWNLVEGVNDPAERSERAIWLDGKPAEPGPVRFHDLDAIEFDDGARLEFRREQERRDSRKLPMVSYEYRQPFGTFAGTLPGGIELASGIGVMEFHDAHW
jgi:hypothetical protein